jgi:hypothetical protein
MFARRNAHYHAVRIDQGSAGAARANVDGKVIRLHYSNPQVLPERANNRSQI